MDGMFVIPPSISISGSVDGGEIEAQLRSLCMIEDTEGTIGSSTQTCNISKPYIGMKFNSHEKAYDLYNAYGLLTGFGIRKSSTNYSRKTEKAPLDKKFVCNKEGHKSIKDKSNEGNVVNHRRETRVGCIAMMRIKLLKDGKWEVNAFVEEHTNPEFSSADKVKMHRSQKQFHRSKAVKRSIGSMFNTGIRPSTISRVINASGNNDEVVTPQQCNYIRTLRQNNIGQECLSIIQHFQSKAAHDPDFYFAMEVDSIGQMRSIFWTDGRSRAAYLKFSDVVVFYVTYKTNKFCLPFAPFTGVNHHRQSTLFGCALLADEQEDTFV